MIRHGDCLDVMAAMETESVSAIVTDPPYDLTSTGGRNGSPSSNDGTGPYARLDRGGFMGKRWDGTGIAFRPETWSAALRVAEPSSYLLAFGGTRTVHRMAVAIEDAGWIIRDMLVWAYASGFPKSKASLKPAWEPVVMARKPGPLRDLAIDECRVPFADAADAADAAESYERNGWLDGPAAINVRAKRPLSDRAAAAAAAAAAAGFAESRARGTISQSQSIGRESRDGTNTYDPETISGRWPANVMLTDPVFDGDVDGVIAAVETSSGSAHVLWRGGTTGGLGMGYGSTAIGQDAVEATYGDRGSYSRFFLIPKADRGEREPVFGHNLTPAKWTDGRKQDDKDYLSLRGARARARANSHPTVKPVDLMRHLVRLVTPPGGICLDPFLGSGTTGIACEMEGFDWIGIEREAEYVAIAEARLIGVQRGMGLVG